MAHVPPILPLHFCKIWLAGFLVLIFLQAGCTEKSLSKPSMLLREAGPTVHVQTIPPIFIDKVSTLHCDVPVKNDTDRLVRFVRVRPSCACSGGTRLDTMELAPGKETVLHFDVDLRGRTGPQRFVCYLVEENGNEWTYSVETTLYERAQFGGAGSTHFGMVDPNGVEVRETELLFWAENRTGLPQEVSFKSEEDRLRVEPGPVTVENLPDGTALRKIPLKLRLQAPGWPGSGHASFQAHYEQNGEKQRLTAGVDWNVRSFYSLSPPQVYFGTVAQADGPIEKQVQIRTTDRKPLTIKSTKVSCPGVSVRVEEGSDESTRRFALCLDPRSLTGPLLVPQRYGERLCRL